MPWLNEYRHHAIEHGTRTREGDAEGANASYDRLHAVLVAIDGEGRERELFSLYEDDDPWVQTWAATHTLEIDEGRALAKLEQLAKSGISHVDTGAKYTIQEWNNGNLRFRLP